MSSIGNVSINPVNVKSLYNFSLQKTVEEKVLEIREENGQKVEVWKPVKKKVPVNFRLVKPTRRIAEASDLYNAKLISEYIQMGIMPLSLVAKRFGNDGGPLTEDERKYIETLEKKARDLNIEYYKFAGENSPEALAKKEELIADIVRIQQDINSVQNAYLSLFENTAEMKAKRKMIDWWSITLAQEEKEVNGKKEFVSIFDGKTMDEKFNKLNDYIESADPFLREIANIFGFFISAWVSASIDMDEENFKNLDKTYQEKFSELAAAEKLEQEEKEKTEQFGPKVVPPNE